MYWLKHKQLIRDLKRFQFQQHVDFDDKLRIAHYVHEDMMPEFRKYKILDNHTIIDMLKEEMQQIWQEESFPILNAFLTEYTSALQSSGVHCTWNTEIGKFTHEQYDFRYFMSEDAWPESDLGLEFAEDQKAYEQAMKTVNVSNYWHLGAVSWYF